MLYRGGFTEITSDRTACPLQTYCTSAVEANCCIAFNKYLAPYDLFEASQDVNFSIEIASKLGTSSAV